MLVSGIGIVLFCAWFFITTPARAAVRIWDGSYSGYWSTGANWSGGVAPANGDDLVFQSGAAHLLNTNNLSGLQLNSITFTGGGYDIRGNAVTLAAGIAGQHTSGTNTVWLDCTLTSSQNFDVVNGAAGMEIHGDVDLGANQLTLNVVGYLAMGGSISGTGGVRKIGGGRARFEVDYLGPLIPLLGGRPNSYTGVTRVEAGTVELRKTRGVLIIGGGYIRVGDTAIAGDLIIGSSSAGPDVVLFDDYGSQIATTASVSITAAGLLNLNNQSNSIGPLSMTGGRISTGSGLLTLLDDVTAKTYSVGTYPVPGIYGRIGLNSTRTFDMQSGPTSPALDIYAEISGAGGLTKTGVAGLELHSANSYSGLTTVSQGQIIVGDSLSLGDTSAGTVVNGGAGLVLLNAVNVGAESLHLAGAGVSLGALWSANAASASWAGPITLDQNATIGVVGAAGRLTLSGTISGSANLTKIGDGTLAFSGSANTYTGDTLVNEGTLELGKSGESIPSGTLTIGDGTGVDVVREVSPGYQIATIPIVINSSGLLDLNGRNDTVGALTFNGGDVVTGAGTLYLGGNVTVNADPSSAASISGKLGLGASTRTFTVADSSFTPDLSISASVSGSGGLIMNGDGTLLLGSSNSFGGLVTVKSGSTLLVEDDFALGSTNNGAIVNTGGRLLVRYNTQVGNEPITINGDGPFHNGCFGGVSGNNSWNGDVTLNSDSMIGAFPGTSDQFVLNGAIGGPWNLVKSGPSMLIFDGSAANTYTGSTTVKEGTLVLSKSGLNAAIQGPVIVGDGVGGSNADVLRLAAVNQIVNTAPVFVDSSGLYDMNGFGDAIGSLSGNGNVQLGSANMNLGFDNSTATFSGIIDGTGGINKFTATTGTQIFNGDNTYTGITFVNGGTLVVNGSQPQSSVTVGSSGTLAGNGTVGTLTVNGNLAPGASPGILTSSNLTFTAGGAYSVELTGPNPGTDYDQVNVRGTNNLGGAVLHMAASFVTPVTPGDQLRIINNDGGEAVTGTFAGLPDGSAINQDGYTFVISYGNDVVLTVTNVPGAGGAAVVTMGNGNHAIDPNECDSLDLVVSNQTALLMSGVTATLSTRTPNVMINQPYSDYPDVPASESRTNITPFQIAILPAFTAGSEVDLELTVNTATHGSFIIPITLHSGAPSAVASRYDVNVSTNIPDVGTIESTNVVTAFSGSLAKVAVSLWLTHTYDGDLDISLISPAGVVVDLSSGNGGGANFGSSCSPDSSRTTFDDSAATSITAGAPPFVGTFRPEASLADFVGGVANGNWRLRVTDNNGGTLGALRCWSLFLYPIESLDGGGYCDVCLPAIPGEITASDPLQTGRWFRDGIGTGSSCGLPKSWPGLNDSNPHHYDVYTFTNVSLGDACVTVGLQGGSNANVMAAAYLDSFDPADISTNYLGDAGGSTGTQGGTALFSCSVPAGATFLVVVNEVSPNSGTLPYTLFLSGLPCPPPSLAIDPASPAPAVRVHWPTSAGGYGLEATPSLNPSAWTQVGVEPVVSGGRFTITNSAPPTNEFYRLHKP